MAEQVREQFGDYRLMRRLGGGTFGDVYVAEHIRDKTQVALKVLKTDEEDNEEDIESYINEIRALFRLQHRNIVPLLDFGIEQRVLDANTREKIPFFVMAYASKGTLRQFRGKKISLGNVVNFARQIAEALQYAHDRRIIHRDVKPQNILLSSNSQVWLADFGIAGVAHTESSLKNQGKAGTFAYMAPEQSQGFPEKASDQYSLGIVVCELMCGILPSYSEGLPSFLNKHVPDLPPAVKDVIMTALKEDPKHRFASVRAFANALEQAVKAPAIHPIVEPKPSDKIQVQIESANLVPEVKPAPPITPTPSTKIIEPSAENKITGSEAPPIARGRADKVASKPIPTANKSAPLESFDKPALPPHVAPVISVSAPPSLAALPLNDDEKRVKPLLAILPSEQAPEAEDSALMPEQRTIQQENHQRLYAARAQLAPAEQQLIELRYEKELSLVAIAEMLKMPEGSVREMLARTLHQLHVIYEKTERGAK